jgi:hypothetical protein
MYISRFAVTFPKSADIAIVGMMFSPNSGIWNVAPDSAIVMSAQVAMAQPKAERAPFTAAITGSGQSRNAL